MVTLIFHCDLYILILTESNVRNNPHPIYMCFLQKANSIFNVEIDNDKMKLEIMYTQITYVGYSDQ